MPPPTPRLRCLIGARRVLGALGAAALLAGCQYGTASFSGDLGAGRSFDPNGTTFSYIDGHDDDLNVIDRPRVVVFSTWVIFDPTADLNDLDGASLEELRHELRLRDAMTLIFDDQADLSAGATFESVVEDDDERLGEGLTTRVHFAPERLTVASVYAEFRPLASRRRVQVELTTAGFDDTGPKTVAGLMTLALERTDGDPADAHAGTVEGRFNAPLVSERLAEHNLSLLAIDDILDVPLAPADPAPDTAPPDGAGP